MYREVESKKEKKEGAVSNYSLLAGVGYLAHDAGGFNAPGVVIR
jgi:hypothetical protein